MHRRSQPRFARPPPSVERVHRNSLLMFERYASSYIGSGARVLEIGPDTIPSAIGLIPVQKWRAGTPLTLREASR